MAIKIHAELAFGSRRWKVYSHFRPLEFNSFFNWFHRLRTADPGVLQHGEKMALSWIELSVYSQVPQGQEGNAG